MQAMKKCWKCGCEKPLEAFGRDARRHDGKNPKCKACVNLASAEYRQANPEKLAVSNDMHKRAGVFAVAKLMVGAAIVSG